MEIATLNIPAYRKANKALVAEWFGVSIPAVDGWIRRGCPSVQRGEKGRPWVFDLLKVAEWRFRHDEGPIDPSGMTPKDRLDHYRAERERLKLEQETGSLIPAAEVESVTAEVMKTLAQTLDTLPDVLERDAGISGEAVQIVQRVIDSARESMYSDVVRLVDGNGSISGSDP